MSALKHAIAIEAFNEVRRHTLRGFAKIILPSGMIMIDVAIHVQGNSAWAAPPSKPMLDRNGDTMRDGGKVRYAPVIAFRSKELRDRFSAQVIEALRRSRPEALS